MPVEYDQDVNKGVESYGSDDWENAPGGKGRHGTKPPWGLMKRNDDMKGKLVMNNEEVKKELDENGLCEQPVSPSKEDEHHPQEHSASLAGDAEARQAPSNDNDGSVAEDRNHRKGYGLPGISEKPPWRYHMEFLVAYLGGIGSIVTCDNWATVEVWVFSLGRVLWHIMWVIF